MESRKLNMNSFIYVSAIVFIEMILINWLYDKYILLGLYAKYSPADMWNFSFRMWMMIPHNILYALSFVYFFVKYYMTDRSLKTAMVFAVYTTLSYAAFLVNAYVAMRMGIIVIVALIGFFALKLIIAGFIVNKLYEPLNLNKT